MTPGLHGLSAVAEVDSAFNRLSAGCQATLNRSCTLRRSLGKMAEAEVLIRPVLMEPSHHSGQSLVTSDSGGVSPKGENGVLDVHVIAVGLCFNVFM